VSSGRSRNLAAIETKGRDPADHPPNEPSTGWTATSGLGEMTCRLERRIVAFWRNEIAATSS
jgi:hypothetical protein